MGLPQVEEERLGKYVNIALDTCTTYRSCRFCPAKDDRLTFDDRLIFLAEENGLKTTNPYVFERSVCPLGLTLGKRVEDYAKNNPSKHSENIKSIAKELQKDSVGFLESKKIIMDLKETRRLLNQVKDETFEFPSITVPLPNRSSFRLKRMAFRGELF